MQDRIFNFSSGPAMLPEPILQEAQKELLNWRGLGLSVLEISHRSTPYLELIESAEATFRELCCISEDYDVLFLQGGGRGQFSAVPLNLAGARADYINTGIWSTRAIKEARKYTRVHIAATGEFNNFTAIPDQATWALSGRDTSYVHIVSNETIGGVEFREPPEVDAPLVADMSSNILSRPINIERYGVIYAGAQKNIGPAGLALVVVRKDLLNRVHPLTPSILNYTQQARARSLYNTPPVYACYFADKMFEWVKQEGGLSEMARRAEVRSQKLYAAIDRMDFYNNDVRKKDRSRMNIVFTLADPRCNATFLKEAEDVGLANLKGHALVGGMRASLYNSMPESGVDALIDFMEDFSNRYQ